MNRTEAKAIIEAHPHRTLVVRFIKRTDGSLRRMVCIHFPKQAEFARFRFNPAAKGLAAVWDLEKGARRFVNLDGVQSIKAGGKTLTPNERRADDRPPKKSDTRREREPAPTEANASAPNRSGEGWHFEDLEHANRVMRRFFY